MKKALISVSDKKGIESLAIALNKAGYQLISTGGTANYLQERSIPTTLVEEVTNFPEILNGRVKTLHPKILGAILADDNNSNHVQELKQLSIDRIDMVVVNLYPFAQVFKKYLDGEIDHQTMIENIDIGGVTLLRAAAKNYNSVTVVTEIGDYSEIENDLNSNGNISTELKLKLAQKAFKNTSDYDRVIFNYLSKINASEKQIDDLFHGYGKEALRYGENPHQSGYFLFPQEEHKIIDVFHGKQLSYNNYLDIDAALQLIVKFEKTTAAIFKHNNPCGVASSDSLITAYRKAFATDTQSPYGGIIVVNRIMDIDTAKAVNEVFTEIIIAPDYQTEAVVFLKKKKMRRLIRYDINKLNSLKDSFRLRSCINGILIQNADLDYDNIDDWRVVTENKPEDKLRSDVEVAWKVVSTLKSNAICLVAEESTIGMGMGQTSRVDALELAVHRAKKFGHKFENVVCASDGFFPFRDSIDLLKNYGVKVIIQPGGSKGDNEVITACNEYGIAMIFTGMRHFSH